MTNLVNTILQELKECASLKQASVLSYFFKTGKGQYGEGDIFLGLYVPQVRTIVKKYSKEITLEQISELLISKYHEVRLTALLCLVEKYQHYIKESRKDNSKINKALECVEFYINNTQYINNWDLVDISCIKILGQWILKDNTVFEETFPPTEDILYTFAHSGELWKERISIVTCIAFVKKGRFKECLDISAILLDHPHDLIHKAVGWTLREMGKVDRVALDNFLFQHAKAMSRTTLRYAIEKHSPQERQDWLRNTKEQV